MGFYLYCYCFYRYIWIILCGLIIIIIFKISVIFIYSMPLVARVSIRVPWSRMLTLRRLGKIVTIIAQLNVTVSVVFVSGRVVVVIRIGILGSGHCRIFLIFLKLVVVQWW